MRRDILLLFIFPASVPLVHDSPCSTPRLAHPSPLLQPSLSYLFPDDLFPSSFLRIFPSLLPPSAFVAPLSAALNDRRHNFEQRSNSHESYYFLLFNLAPRPEPIPLWGPANLGPRIIHIYLYSFVDPHIPFAVLIRYSQR